MAGRIDPRHFVDTMLPVVRQCAQASLIFYGKTADIGKAADTSLNSTEAQAASGALTALDNAVQDIVLSVALQHFPQARCIAEENTPLKRRFADRSAAHALILDPIDGTLHFQKGDAPYHISLGLAHNGRMEAALVARPSEDKIFTAVRGQGAYLQIAGRRPRRLRLKKKTTYQQSFYFLQSPRLPGTGTPHSGAARVPDWRRPGSDSDRRGRTVCLPDPAGRSLRRRPAVPDRHRGRRPLLSKRRARTPLSEPA